MQEGPTRAGPRSRRARRVTCRISLNSDHQGRIRRCHLQLSPIRSLPAPASVASLIRPPTSLRLERCRTPEGLGHPDIPTLLQGPTPKVK